MYARHTTYNLNRSMMEELLKPGILPETISIGLLAMALIYVVYKQWVSSQHLTQKVISVVEKNAESHTKLIEVISRLEDTTKTNTEVTRSTAKLVESSSDIFSKLALEMIKSEHGHNGKSRK